ncbi:MAG: DUF3307 domain-containing protein [Bacteroidota bacterium]|nr:DUF3307 domain-containing protein [Bacteroidota bacterium]
MNMVILWRLLFAHFLADFILQTEWICHEKKQRNAKGMGVLGIHCLIHAAVAYLLVGQWDNWMIPTVIFVSHYAMDWYKVHRMDLGLTPFLIDQSVHILVILALWTVGYADLDSLVKTVDTWNTPSTWVVGLAYILALKPAGLLGGNLHQQMDSQGDERTSIAQRRHMDWIPGTCDYSNFRPCGTPRGRRLPTRRIEHHWITISRADEQD